MKKTLPAICLILTGFLFHLSLLAQPMKAPTYTVENVWLPPSMNKQVCISGMTTYKNQLYFASERCPQVFVFDATKKEIIRTIDIKVPQFFEMEGMTSYKNKLYLVSENLAAVYEVNIETGELKTIQTSTPLPEKLKSGDGMEGIAASEKNNKFYLLRERNEDLSRSQIYTYSVKSTNGSFILEYESMIELPLESPQWRYSDITVDEQNNRLLCLKSFAKGKQRQQYIETLSINAKGDLVRESLQNLPIDNFSDVSNSYKSQDYSMNLEGVTIMPDGTIYMISDNTSGKADCSMEAKEKTILLAATKN